MKIKSLILGIALLLSVVSAFAQGGTMGPLTWKIENNTLTISGEGAMPDYDLHPSAYNTAPWYEYRESIHSVVIEVGVIGIGRCAFYACYNLTSIIIPNNVTSIGGGAFLGCSMLPSITLPNGITSIESITFFDCKSLASITLPETITSIDREAFWYCESLTLITNLNPVPVAISGDVFGGVNKSACTLEVPIHSVEAYKEAAVWKEFKIVGVEVGMEQLTMDNGQLTIFPNPTTGKVYIETESAIKVYDAQGVLLQETFGNQVDLSAYPQGVYLLQVNDGRWSRVVKQ